MIRTCMPRAWILAGLMTGGIATAAWAQDATGDWIGKVKTPAAELTITLHVAKGADGALSGYAGSPDQTPNPLPMADIAVKGDTLTFAVPVVQGTYTGKWDATTSAWHGTFTQVGFDMPLSLAHGKAAPRPVVAGLDGEWSGVLEAPQGDLRLVIKVRTGPDGTWAMFASPDQGPGEMAADVTHEGDAVSFQLKGIGGFDGKMSADGKTIDGTWRQGGGSLPLTIKRGG